MREGRARMTRAQETVLDGVVIQRAAGQRNNMLVVLVETATENASADDDADDTFLLNSLLCIPRPLHVALRRTS